MALILFDFDGVLADTLEDALNFAREACAQMGIACDPTPNDLEALETMSVVDYGRQLKLPPERIDEFADRYLEMFNQKPHPPKIFQGMDEVIAQAAKHNNLAIVTGNTTMTVEAFLREHRLTKYVDLIIGVEKKVSRSEKIKTAIRELGRSEETVYMVGDALSDIRAARETSTKSIAVGWGHQSPARLMTAKPDYLVNSAQELLDLLKQLGIFPRKQLVSGGK